jgi:beta-phosphoglucomutase-like phosphatase (HAD superfamily)
MSDIGLVIFDCDGVLVDSEPLAMRVLLESPHRWKEVYAPPPPR